MSGASCCDMMSQRSSFDVPDSRRQSLEFGAATSGPHLNVLGAFPPLMSPIAETSGFGAEPPSVPPSTVSGAMQERRASLSLQFGSGSGTKSEAKLQRSNTTTVRNSLQRVNSPHASRLTAPGSGSSGIVKRTRITKPLWLKKRQTSSIDIPDATSEQEW